MDASEITKKDIEELVSYLPILYNDDVELYKIKTDGKYIDDFYHYNKNLNSFIRLVLKPCWFVSSYSDELIKNNGIESASLNELKSLLTCCARGEKFRQGHFAIMVERKVIKRILERLKILLKDDLL